MFHVEIVKQETGMATDTGGFDRLEAHGEVVKYMRDDMRDFYDHELKMRTTFWLPMAQA
jgi:hypothetical protein